MIKYCFKFGMEVFTVYVRNNTGYLYGDSLFQLFNLSEEIFLKYFDSSYYGFSTKKIDDKFSPYSSFDQILKICYLIKEKIESGTLEDELKPSIKKIDKIIEYINQ